MVHARSAGWFSCLLTVQEDRWQFAGREAVTAVLPSLPFAFRQPGTCCDSPLSSQSTNLLSAHSSLDHSPGLVDRFSVLGSFTLWVCHRGLRVKGELESAGMTGCVLTTENNESVSASPGSLPTWSSYPDLLASNLQFSAEHEVSPEENATLLSQRLGGLAS